MTYARFLKQPLAIVRASTGRDEYGNWKATDADPVNVLGFLDFTQSTEQTQDRDTVTNYYRVYLASDVEIGPLDRIVAAGVSYQVQGQPHRVFNPRTGRYHHTEVDVQEAS